MVKSLPSRDLDSGGREVTSVSYSLISTHMHRREGREEREREIEQISTRVNVILKEHRFDTSLWSFKCSLPIDNDRSNKLSHDLPGELLGI